MYATDLILLELWLRTLFEKLMKRFSMLISRGGILDRRARILLLVLNGSFHNLLGALRHATQISNRLLVKGYKFKL